MLLNITILIAVFGLLISVVTLSIIALERRRTDVAPKVLVVWTLIREGKRPKPKLTSPKEKRLRN